MAAISALLALALPQVLWLLALKLANYVLLAQILCVFIDNTKILELNSLKIINSEYFTYISNEIFQSKLLESL
jgi:hypothetical protein